MTEPTWDLTHLYKSITDPKLLEDIETYVEKSASFAKQYQGKISENFAAALVEMEEMTTYVNACYAYVFLKASTDAENEKVQKCQSRIHEQFSKANAALTFWEIEIAHISEDVYQNLLNTDETVKRYKPYIDDIRADRPYQLDETVERALTLRSPFGANEWSDFIEEQESLMTFDFEEKTLTMSEIFSILQTEKKSERRAAAQAVIYKTLKSAQMHKFMARALNIVMGAKSIEDSERGYEHPMHARHLSNKVEKASVDALHTAVATEGAKQCQRYYKLKAKLLKKDTLLWSDRNAPLPFKDTSEISWIDCMDIVKKAYASFSPKLAELVTWIEAQKMIDVAPKKGKRSGAYDYTFESPKGMVSYNFLNYTGTSNDVMTTAHELGHGVHGLLAGEAQGALMSHAPMAYAETASIFGEMVTFNYILSKTTDKKARLALLMDKIGDFMNTVVRQISFSEFEKKCHEMRKESKLDTASFDAIWMDVTQTFYGKEGEVFQYNDMDNMWCYVHHFLRPFYVYAYAFGELFTQSLFAKQTDFGERFEPMYLDLLRAGGTKDAVALMAPFGLNPNDPDFWVQGILVSAASWLDEAERLAQDLESENV